MITVEKMTDDQFGAFFEETKAKAKTTWHFVVLETGEEFPDAVESDWNYRVRDWNDDEAIALAICMAAREDAVYENGYAAYNAEGTFLAAAAGDGVQRCPPKLLGDFFASFA